VKRIGTVALVLAGIWVLTQALYALSYPLNLLINGGGPLRRLFAVPVALLPALGGAVLGVWLIARRRELAARWFADDGPDVRFDGHALLRAGILVIAVAAFVGGVVSLVSAGTQLIFSTGGDTAPGASEVLRILAPRLAAGACGVVIGFVLIAVSAPLSRRLWVDHHRPPTPSRSEPAHCPACGAPYDAADYESGGPFPPTCEACGEPLGVVGT
jgi:hypothetical protein